MTSRAAHRSTLLVVALLALGSLTSDANGQDGADGLDTPMASLERQTASVRQRLAQSEARKERLVAELNGLGEAQSSAATRLRTRARSLYRMSRAGMMPMLGGVDAMLSHVSRVNRLTHIVERDAASLVSLTERGGTIHAEINELGRDIAAAHAEVRALEARKMELVATTALPTLSTTTTMSPSTISISAPVEAEAEPEPAYGTIRAVPDEDTEESEFAGFRGRLPMPVSGDMQIRTDNGPESSGPGLSITLRSGAPVRSVADGRVVFAGRHATQGNLVIVDHGDRYFTVYGGLGSVDVVVGDELSRGARVGSMGGSRDLRFEVRHGSRSENPNVWLGI